MTALPFAVLGVSLLGSGHCIAMCGGLILTVARNPQAIVRYHLGRLLGYCSLGALAGSLGEATLRSQGWTFVSWLTTALLASGFVFLGVRLWRGQPLHLLRLPRGIWQKLVGIGPGATGLFSAFLPCGWLHTFILGAVATRSAFLGAFSLFVFWIGTLPALTLAPFAIAKVFRPLALRVPRLSAILLIMIGIASIGAKMWTLYPFSPDQGVGHSRCH